MATKNKTKTAPKTANKAENPSAAPQPDTNTGEVSTPSQLSALHELAVMAGNTYRLLEETNILIAAEQRKIDKMIEEQFPDFAALQKKANKLKMALEDSMGLKAQLAQAGKDYYETLSPDERSPKLLSGAVQMRKREAMLTYNPDQALDWADEMRYVHLINRSVDKKKIEALLKAGTEVPEEVATFGEVMTAAIYEQELKEYALLHS